MSRLLASFESRVGQEHRRCRQNVLMAPPLFNIDDFRSKSLNLTLTLIILAVSLSDNSVTNISLINFVLLRVYTLSRGGKHALTLVQ